MQAFISSAGADLGITGNVRLKSPASNINMLPKSLEFPRKYYNDRSRSSSDCLCAIVHSSQIISLHCCNTLSYRIIVSYHVNLEMLFCTYDNRSLVL